MSNKVADWSVYSVEIGGVTVSGHYALFNNEIIYVIKPGIQEHFKEVKNSPRFFLVPFFSVCVFTLSVSLSTFLALSFYIFYYGSYFSFSFALCLPALAIFLTWLCSHILCYHNRDFFLKVPFFLNIGWRAANIGWQSKSPREHLD